MRKHLKSIFLADEQRVKGACCIGGELLFLNQMYTQFNLKPTGIIDSY